MNNKPGLNCPECNFKITISIEQLVSGSSVICPSCGLKLEIDNQKSKPAINAVKKLDNALKNNK